MRCAVLMKAMAQRQTSNPNRHDKQYEYSILLALPAHGYERLVFMTRTSQRHVFRFLLVMVSLLSISGCTLTPPPTATAEPPEHARHQAWLAQIHFWNIQGNVAFFNDADQQRDAARYTWRQQSSPAETTFRLYHPLRGTLARLEQAPDGSTFTNQQGEAFHAENIDALLYQHTGMAIPFRLLTEGITGLEPALPTANREWYEDGTLARYTADATVFDWDPQVWQVHLSDYRVVVHEGRSFVLPHLIEATQYPLRLRLSISQWREVLTQ